MAMCCKKWLAKRYLKKRKYYVFAFAIAFLSVIVMAVALILNELSGISDVAYCGCLAFGALTYADCADLETCSKAQMAGVFWIVCGGLGIIMCFVGPLLLTKKKTLSYAAYLLAFLFYTLSVIMWLADNPMCYEDGGSFGISLILAIVAAVIALCAAIVAIIANKKS